MLTLSSRVDVVQKVGHALSEANRARILLALAEAPRYPGDLATDLGLTRSNVSNHLACLRGCGLVVVVPQGRRMRYELADPALAGVLSAIVALDLVASCDGDCATGACTCR
ncbi:MAG: metalloregulator ArsR/SmtB family transcription factor [Aeromicrobium sp.]|uniref:ArsR/SmtB family transcription factor n=1 Tax=Aeromicrobium sp. TaxID=1871063 RepID=UPI00261252AD|nr:metalloregulator ArsR/SmtB family transcription factor [Aeromicrobium sp.]MDF1705460.1 metalloregulator ArsR/SmtB family transcription factor [Aeromicrobium sp.]